MTKDCLKYYEEMIDEYKQMIKVIPSMDEEEMQVTYGTDESKALFLEILQEELEEYEQAVSEHYREENSELSFIDEGFANEADYNRYKYGY